MESAPFHSRPCVHSPRNFCRTSHRPRSFPSRLNIAFFLSLLLLGPCPPPLIPVVDRRTGSPNLLQPKGTPKMEFVQQGMKWIVENQGSSNGVVSVKVTDKKHQVCTVPS